jgi:phosphohistidine swiveling domain-containing protein
MMDKNKIDQQLFELKTKYQKQKEETERICREFGFREEEKEFVDLVQTVIWFRTFRIDVYTKAGFNVKNLFTFLAEKLGLSLEQFVFLTYKEVEEYISKQKKFPIDLAERRRVGSWQLLFDYGTMIFQYEPPFLIQEKQGTLVSEIRGNVACKGIGKGEVCIIRGVKEFHKMKDKAVLVTSMTTPDFVPLMERSIAIVTDEGGITCHAAIVSRELKIPCIIGTKIATRILKDGDMVEVDAEKGTVKKL